MDGTTVTQKQLKQVFLETSRFFKKLSDIFGGQHLAGIVAEEDKDDLASPAPKKSRSRADKSNKSDKAASEKNGGKTSKGKKAKAEKDPNAPKKPLTAFMLYTNNRRPEIKKKVPDLKITEISTMIGKEWKDLTEEEKNIWREKAKEEKLMYELKLYNYQKEQKMDEKSDTADKVGTDKKAGAVAKPSAMNAISGKKRDRSDDDSSIDSSSEEDAQESKHKKQKTK